MYTIPTKDPRRLRLLLYLTTCTSNYVYITEQSQISITKLFPKSIIWPNKLKDYVKSKFQSGSLLNTLFT